MFGKKLDTRQKILSLREILQRAGDARVMWVRGFFDPLLAAHASRIAELRTPGASVAVLLCDPPSPLLAARARAELVAEGALDMALRIGQPGFAALDVFETEPLPGDSPLLRYANVLATPHLGYVEKDSYELYFRAAFQNIVDFANGTPKNVLNPEALQRQE